MTKPDDDDYAETLVLPENPDDDYAATLVLPDDELASRRREKPEPARVLSLPQVRRLLDAAAARQANRKLGQRMDGAVVHLTSPGDEPRE